MFASFFNSVINFFNDIYNFLVNGIYDFMVWVFAGLVQTLTLFSIKFQIMAARFGWDTAVSIINNSHIAAYIETAWTSIPPQISSLLSLLQIPQFISIVFTAFVTKYVMRFMPFAK